MASDAVTAIRKDHRLFEALFTRMRSGEGDVVALLDEVRVRLTAHSRAEEDHVYPAVIDRDPAESDEVYHGYVEHHEAEAILYRLMGMLTKMAPGAAKARRRPHGG